MNAKHGIRGISCLLLVCCVAGTHAQSDVAGASRLELETLQQWDATRPATLTAWRSNDGAQASSQRLLPGLSSNPMFVDDSLRARVWWGRGAVEVGAGADWRAASFTANAAQPWSQVVGVRATLSARTRIVYETGAALPWRSGDNVATGARTSRVALEFKSRKSPVSNLRDGLLRMQLSSDAAVHLKPRGGGLQVTYRERF
jgi:hypothetical protein